MEPFRPTARDQIASLILIAKIKLVRFAKIARSSDDGI
jgi:hypothetical protein